MQPNMHESINLGKLFDSLVYYLYLNSNSAFFLFIT